MRLDLFLKTSRLMPRRSLAQEFCDAGLIRIGGVIAKSSKDVKVGDEIEIRRRDRVVTVKVLEVPTARQVSKQLAPGLFEVIGETVVTSDLP